MKTESVANFYFHGHWKPYCLSLCLTMIEQTEMLVTQWDYTPPQGELVAVNAVKSFIELDIMKKRASLKKGIACRFTARFLFKEKSVLVYVGEDSYVIDLGDAIDKNELIKMIRNSFSKFKEKFELRKLYTVLHSSEVRALDESSMDLDAIIPLED